MLRAQTLQPQSRVQPQPSGIVDVRQLPHPLRYQGLLFRTVPWQEARSPPERCPAPNAVRIHVSELAPGRLQELGKLDLAAALAGEILQLLSEPRSAAP